MILLFYYEESKNTLTLRFENPMAIFKLVVIGIPIRILFQLSAVKHRLWPYDCLTRNRHVALGQGLLSLHPGTVVFHHVS